jgi:oligopeptide/dipeptide ABC transporter ATP-binding protein
VILQGETPNPVDIPSGCRFHPRCPEAIAVCAEIDPADVQISGSHYAACLRLGWRMRDGKRGRRDRET